MFYYLHLTRPPPEQANPTQPLLITPNIANDLRTEYPSPGSDGIDIFYAWTKCIEQTPVPNDEAKTHAKVLGPMTAPQRLTNWTGNSYKEVHVFPPKDSLQGSGEQRWHLLLCTRPTELRAYVASVDLSGENFGTHILPILSAPVLFSTGPRNAKGQGQGVEKKKQVRNERVFKMPSSLWGAGSVGPLRVTEHLSYDLDKKLWDSGVGLSHWLVSAMMKSRSDEFDADIPAIVRSLMQSEEPTILELGAGTGLVSIVLSTLLNHLPARLQANVVATDLGSAMEILEKNVSDNEHCFPSVRLRAAVLDWDVGVFPPDIQGGVDFIIMADVTYNTASFPSLVHTLSRLSRLRPATAPTPAVLLAYEERDPDERRLWDMAREIGLHLQEVGCVPGAGGMPVEIYAGTFERGSD